MKRDFIKEFLERKAPKKNSEKHPWKRAITPENARMSKEIKKEIGNLR